MAKPLTGALTKRRKVEKKRISMVSEGAEVLCTQLLFFLFVFIAAIHHGCLRSTGQHNPVRQSYYTVPLSFMVKIDNKILIPVGSNQFCVQSIYFIHNKLYKRILLCYRDLE